MAFFGKFFSGEMPPRVHTEPQGRRKRRNERPDQDIPDKPKDQYEYDPTRTIVDNGTINREEISKASDYWHLSQVEVRDFYEMWIQKNPNTKLTLGELAELLNV
jgi:hypothetical protein